MKYEKFVIDGCTACGKSSTSFKIDTTVSKDFLALLVQHGFKELPQFTSMGILYVENSNLIVTGGLGTDKLQIKCKISDCTIPIAAFEAYLDKL